MKGYGFCRSIFDSCGNYWNYYLFSKWSRSSSVSICNAFPERIKVSLDGSNIYVSPHSCAKTNFSRTKNFEVQSWTADRELIETFQPSLGHTSKRYVYNIAGAGALIEWTAHYGRDRNENIQLMGNERWSITNVDYVFVDPPESLRTDGGTSKGVFTGVSDTDPSYILSLIEDENQQSELIRAHAIWEKSNSPYILTLLAMAGSLDDFKEIINKRIERSPFEVEAARAKMYYGSESDKNSICQTLNEQLSKDPSNSDLVYLTTRCLPDGKIQNDGFIKGYEKSKENGWLAFAGGYIYANNGEWQKANDAFLTFQWYEYQRTPVI
jgi:hypothetical protein